MQRFCRNCWPTAGHFGRCPKKEQVVETTCESHEKTSIGNFDKSEEVAF
jgi:hypothetical protein